MNTLTIGGRATAVPVILAGGCSGWFFVRDRVLARFAVVDGLFAAVLEGQADQDGPAVASTPASRSKPLVLTISETRSADRITSKR